MCGRQVAAPTINYLSKKTRQNDCMGDTLSPEQCETTTMNHITTNNHEPTKL
ncbi:MAG: hypothetical protein FWE22_05085 [Firmicutes bacterium]|nr:hypothetical protein [Bacillota bacterium]